MFKYILSLLALCFSSLSFGQTLDEFYNPVFKIEQELQNKYEFSIYLADANELQTLYDSEGLVLEIGQANKLLGALEVLETDILFNTYDLDINSIKNSLSSFITLTTDEANNLLTHISYSEGVLVGPNAHVYLMSLISEREGVSFKEIMEAVQEEIKKMAQQIEEEIKEAQRPARPDSPTSISVNRVIKRSKTFQFITLPKASGDWLGNAYTQVNASYVSYNDRLANGSGTEEGISVVLGGEIAEDTSLSFSFGRSRNHRKGEDKLTSVSLGGDFMVHHKFTDEYGLGAFGYYQDTDIEEVDSNAFGYGGGLLFSTYHESDHFYLSTANTWVKSLYEYGNDQLYIGSVWLGHHWSDQLSTALIANFVDSLKSDQVGDNTYWTLGGEITYALHENASVTVSYEKTTSLDDYDADTFYINFIWLF
ncbi:MAG: hypothetical protein MK132_09800 [Lentisphaerales bacterium]|nr:hypothetical protein [Lentisphaerales bacterium]